MRALYCRLLLCLVMCPLLLLTASAQEEAWIKGYGGSGFEYGRFVEPTADGGFAVGGTRSKTPTSQIDDFWVARFDSTGELLWERTYGHANVGHTIFTFNSTRDGGFMIGGFTGQQFSGTESALMYRIDGLGNVVWEHEVDYGDSDHWHLLLERPDGGYYFGGHTDSKNDASGDAWLVRLDADRNVIWEKFYDRGTPEHAHAGIVTRDGGAFLLGHTQVGNLEKFWAVKVDSNGTVQWNRVLTSGPSVHDSPYDVFETQDGKYAMVGGSGTNSTGQAWLIVVDSTGRTVIDENFGNPAGSSFAWSGRQARDGGFILVGHTNYRTEGLLDMYVVKTDAEGNVVWEQNYGGTNLDYGFDIVEVSDGFIAVGLTRSPEIVRGGGDDLLMVKIMQAAVLPQAVRLKSPASATTGVERNPTLSWHEVAGAQRYHLEVAVDAGFTVLSFSDTSITDLSAAVGQLAPSTRYWWRARANNDAGWGPFSAAWTFTTAAPISSADAERDRVDALHVVPNPATSHARVDFTLARTGDVEVSIVNAHGEVVGQVLAESREAGTYRVNVDLHDLAAGVYAMRLTNDDTIVALRRFVTVR